LKPTIPIRIGWPVAIFADRTYEPKEQAAYRDLLASPRVRRIYLEEVKVSAQDAPGLRILQLITAPRSEAQHLVTELLHRPDCEPSKVVVQLVEELLMRLYTELNREEIRRMFKLNDIRESRVWQEAHEEGREEGRIEERGEFVRLLHQDGQSLKEIAKTLKIPLAEVRRLVRG